MSIRFKITLYIVAGIIVLFLTYGNVKGTVNMVADYYRLKKMMYDNNYAFRSVNELKQELQQYNQQLGYTTTNEISNQSRLLNFISEYCNTHKTRISLLPQSHSIEKNGYEIETNIVQLEGDYKEILQMIYAVEQEKKLSKVVSVNFELKQDWLAKSKKLFATVYFQNIKAK